MATLAAGSAFRLLGAKDLGVSTDYRTARMPPVNTGLLEGRLAWRQHDGGHTDLQNWKYFIPWVSKALVHKAPPLPSIPADVAVPRADANSIVAHAQLVEKAKKGGIDLYFLGDSITRRWEATDYPELLANWKRNFFGWSAANFGWGADRTQNILWRLQNGELDNVNPKVVVLQAGTNNIGNASGAAEIAKGLHAILDTIRNKAPDATVILTGLFARNDIEGAMEVVREVNQSLARFADGSKVRYLDLNDKLTDPSGRLFPGMMNPDKLHPSLRAYQLWADALKPLLHELMGPPGLDDHHG